MSGWRSLNLVLPFFFLILFVKASTGISIYAAVHRSSQYRPSRIAFTVAFVLAVLASLASSFMPMTNTPVTNTPETNTPMTNTPMTIPHSRSQGDDDEPMIPVTLLDSETIMIICLCVGLALYVVAGSVMISAVSNRNRSRSS